MRKSLDAFSFYKTRQWQVILVYSNKNFVHIVTGFFRFKLDWQLEVMLRNDSNLFVLAIERLYDGYDGQFAFKLLFVVNNYELFARLVHIGIGKLNLFVGNC